MIRTRFFLTRVLLLACAALSFNKILIFSDLPVHAAGILYAPRIVHQGSGFVGETQTYLLEVQSPYVGSVTWYVNGEKQVATSAVFMPTFALPGRMVVTARVNDTRELTHMSTDIRSFSHVVLESLLPNPFSPDPEEIVLRNQNDYPVTLRNWRLQSQTSLAMVSLNELILPHEAITIRVERKLINNGGAYGLFNEADQLVDVATYGNAPPGQRLVRAQTRWYFPAPDVDEPGISQAQSESVRVSHNTITPDSAEQTLSQSADPRLVGGSVWLRIWINLLIVGGAQLLLSSWPKKSV